MAKIIKPDPGEPWGQARLFARKTWGRVSRGELHFLANGVVDRFHQKVQAARRHSKQKIDVQWIPREAHLISRGDDQPNIKDLLSMLEAAYREIRAENSG